MSRIDLHTWLWFPGLLAAPLAGCGGGDLLLPSTSAPADLVAVSGDDQEGVVGSRLSEPLVVRASDGAGRPVAGARIVFDFTFDVGGVIAPDTALTGEDGQAAAEVRLGDETGQQTVEASVADLAVDDLRVRFDLTARARSGGGDSGGGDGGGGDSGGDGDGGGGGGGGDDDDDEENNRGSGGKSGKGGGGSRGNGEDGGDRDREDDDD